MEMAAGHHFTGVPGLIINSGTYCSFLPPLGAELGRAKRDGTSVSQQPQLEQGHGWGCGEMFMGSGQSCWASQSCTRAKVAGGTCWVSKGLGGG